AALCRARVGRIPHSPFTPGDCGGGVWGRASLRASARPPRSPPRKGHRRLEQRRSSQVWRGLRPLRSVLAVLLVTLPLLGSSTARAAGPVSAVDSVAITVSDADRAVDFYSRVLTFEKVADREVA